MTTTQVLADAIQPFFHAMPPGWTRAWLHVEMAADGSGGTAWGAVRGAEGEPPCLVDLPPQVLIAWQKLWISTSEETSPWASAELTLEPSGRFDLHYGFDPPGDEPPLTRQSRWLAAIDETHR